MEKVVVVVPTYEERENIGLLVAGVRASLPQAELLVVDDGSPDGTADVARGLGCTVLSRAGKQGLASAYVAGFSRALDEGADRVVQMDADLSHDPADLPRLLAPDADSVLGSRYVAGGGTRNWPLRRRALSRFGSSYARWTLGLPQRDLTGGFKCWRADTLCGVLAEPVRSEGYAFQVELTLRAVRAGAQVVEVPIVFTERTIGASKMGWRIAVEAAWLVPRLLSTRPGSRQGAGHLAADLRHFLEGR